MVTLDTIRDIKIYQPKNGYRFSVDALLLYDFVNVRRARMIADLGAGSGIVGILLAKKYIEAEVTLFEIQKSLASLAEKNIELNSLNGRVKVIKSDLREIAERSLSVVSPHSFDIAVSNPPFRKEVSGLLSPEEEKAVARHEIKLKLPELIKAAYYMLRARGRLFLVYLPERLMDLMAGLKKERMEVKRLRVVHSDPASEAKMVLVEAVRDGRTGLKIEAPFYIYRKNGEYSDEMRMLCSANH
ncbi:MAG: tRNA1(Val) (adenine(37)-N6)-methyltransferase [Nitrospirota bacterium]